MSNPSWKDRAIAAEAALATANELIGEQAERSLRWQARVTELEADVAAATTARVTAIGLAESAVARVVVLEDHLATGPCPGPAPAWDDPVLAPIVAATRQVNATARAAMESTLPETATAADLEARFGSNTDRYLPEDVAEAALEAAPASALARALRDVHAARRAEAEARRAELAANTEQPNTRSDGPTVAITKGSR